MAAMTEIRPERLIELETKLAYQEEALHVLNQVVTRQQKQIDQLEQLCRQLAERIRSAGEPLPAGTPAEEVPPHY
jgi:SlyX protein